MRQRHNQILGRQLPARFFATAKKRVCFGNLNLGKLPVLPERLGLGHRGFRNTLTPRQCEWRHVHEGNPLLDVLARKNRRKGTLRLGIHSHHGHTSEFGMIGIHVIIIHVDQDLATSCLGCDVPLFSNRAVTVESNLLGLRKLTDQILNLVVTIIHNDPLQLISGIRLTQERLLRQTKELATIAGDGQNTDLREILLRGQKFLDALRSGLYGKSHRSKTIHPCLVTRFLFLSNQLGGCDTLRVAETRLLLKLRHQGLHRRLRKIAQTVRMRDNLGDIRKQRVLCEFTKRRDIRENQVTTRRHGFIDRMAKSLGSRGQNHETTLVQKSIVFLKRKNAGLHLHLGRNHRRNGILTHDTWILHNVKLRKLFLNVGGFLLNPHLGLKNRAGVTPRILTDRDQCLVLIAEFSRNLINARPTDLLDGTSPAGKEILGFVCLDPNLIQMGGQRLPVRVCPFRIGDPNVATSLRKQRRIQNLKEDIDLGFITLRMRVVNLTKLDIVFPEDVRDNSHQKSCILHEPWAAVGNQINSHYIISGCVL